MSTLPIFPSIPLAVLTVALACDKHILWGPLLPLLECIPCASHFLPQTFPVARARSNTCGNPLSILTSAVLKCRHIYENTQATLDLWEDSWRMSCSPPEIPQDNSERHFKSPLEASTRQSSSRSQLRVTHDTSSRCLPGFLCLLPWSYTPYLWHISLIHYCICLLTWSLLEPPMIRPITRI